MGCRGFYGGSDLGPFSGAHLNPAVTLALAIAHKFSWAKVPVYICAQVLGAMFGAGLAWLAYKKHFDATDDGDAKLAVFCTAPNIRSYWYNVLTEVIGTYVLSLAVLYMAEPEVGLGALNALPVALVVLGIRIIARRTDRLCYKSCHVIWDLV